MYIGLGYSFQKVRSINTSGTDVPLDGYVDDTGIYTFR